MQETSRAAQTAPELPGAEPERVAPKAALTRRFSQQARRDTRPEVTLRRVLHRRGLRYRVQYRIPALPRRSVDIAFTRAKVAVLVDGCFWHGCPEHCVLPKANRDWWVWKFATNRARDKDTDARLAEAGWLVLRAWEHEDPHVVADRVIAAVRDRAPSVHKGATPVSPPSSGPVS